MSHTIRVIVLIALASLLSCGGKEKGSSGTASQPQKPGSVQVTWEKLLRKDGFRLFGVAVEILPDTSYVFAGSSQQITRGENVYVLKLDKYGSMLWEQSYSRSVPGWANGLVSAFDGGFVLACQSTPTDTARAGIFLFKVDSLGQYRWDRTLTSSGEEGCGGIARTLDSNYMVVGSMLSTDQGQKTTFLAKVDRQGNLIWKKSYPELGARGGTGISAISDGGFLVLSSVVVTSPSANENVLAFKTDAEGKPVWHVSLGGEGYDACLGSAAAGDGGWVLTGVSSTAKTESNDLYLAKVNSAGKIEWEKTYGGPESEGAYSVAAARDGGFIAAGVERSPVKGILQVLLVKVDKDGNQLWEKTYEAGDAQQARAIRTCPDGGFIIAAGARKPRSEDWGAYIIKTDENGDVSAQSRLPDSLRQIPGR